MRKIMFFSCSLVVLVACKKDYTCECAYYTDSSVEYTSDIINGTRKSVAGLCEKTHTYDGGSIICMIKD